MELECMRMERCRMRRLVSWCSKGHFDNVMVNAMHGWKTCKKRRKATFQQLPKCREIWARVAYRVQ